MTKKKQVGVRFDSNRTRLKTGETQRPNGTYAYRWSTPDGKRHSIYAPTLEKLREQEEQIKLFTFCVKYDIIPIPTLKGAPVWGFTITNCGVCLKAEILRRES